MVGALLRFAVAPVHWGYEVNAELAAFACHHRTQHARATIAQPPGVAGAIMRKLDLACEALNDCVRLLFTEKELCEVKQGKVHTAESQMKGSASFGSADLRFAQAVHRAENFQSRRWS